MRQEFPHGPRGVAGGGQAVVHRIPHTGLVDPVQISGPGNGHDPRHLGGTNVRLGIGQGVEGLGVGGGEWVVHAPILIDNTIERKGFSGRCAIILRTGDLRQSRRAPCPSPSITDRALLRSQPFWSSWGPGEGAVG